MWQAPCAANTRSASARTASRFATPVRTASTPAPRARRSPDVSSSARASTSAITTFMPSAANAPASARPMPLAPPVTTATRPLNSFTALQLEAFARHVVVALVQDRQHPLLGHAAQHAAVALGRALLVLEARELAHGHVGDRIERRLAERQRAVELPRARVLLEPVQADQQRVEVEVLVLLARGEHLEAVAVLGELARPDLPADRPFGREIGEAHARNRRAHAIAVLVQLDLRDLLRLAVGL